MFTQFRMPMLLEQRKYSERILIYGPKGEESKALEQRGFEQHNAPVSNRPGVHTPKELLRLLCFLRRNHFDVLIAHQPMGAVVGITAGFLARTELKIYSTGGLKFSPDKKTLSNSAMKWAEFQGIIRMSDAVFLVNKDDERLLKEIPSIADKAYYVGPRGGCGVDVETYNPAYRKSQRSSARQQLGIRGGTFVVGFSSRVVWEKGFQEIITAAEILSKSGEKQDIVFLVFGDGVESAQVQAQVHRRGLSKFIVFLGYKSDISFYISAFDIFILPSYREGLPVSLLEALALGIPCIATDIRGCRDLIQHEKTGLLIPVRNAVALAEAVLQLKRNSDNSNKMGEEAAKYVSAHFAEQSLVAKTSAILEQLVLRQREAGPAN
jgi:glycosyltransferase involved in cell wall biosynthesis